jgi:hypothetical protein
MKHLRKYIRQLLIEAPQDYFDMEGMSPEEYQLDPGEDKPPKGEEDGKTVGQAMEEIKAKEVSSKDVQRHGMLKKLGWEFPKMIPVLGAIPVLIEFLNDERKIASDTAPGAIEGVLLDYPLLDTWDINRNLFKVIDNELLEVWEDEYMEEVVAKVTPETFISELIDINDYIAKKIAEITGGEVVVEIAT